MVPCYAILLVILALFLPLGSSDFIDSTCKQTPNYDTCVSVIRADPKSSSATDVTSLALIVVDSLKSKSTSAVQTIDQLLKKPISDPKLKVGLDQCLEKYNFILKYNISQAVEALTKGNPKFAEEATKSAASVVQECEDGLKPSSPISNINKAAHDTADVATSLVKLLL